MRCLTLARALIERGAECAFVESRAAAPILRRFGWPGQTLLAISDAHDLAGLVAYARDFADRFQPHVVVVDHYGAGVGEEAALKRELRQIVVDRRPGQPPPLLRPAARSGLRTPVARPIATWRPPTPRC